MKYLDPNGLAKLKQADDARLDRLYRSKATRSWSRTDKAGAVTCWPVGGTQLKPTVVFLFAETPPASGDKGPENPSIISGVSSVNVGRIGKNLLLQATGAPSSYTIVRNDDGSLLISGSGSAMFAVTDSGPGTTGPYSSYRFNLNKQYTLSVEVVSGSFSGASINLAQSSATQRVVSIPASGKASTTFTPSTVGYVDGRFVCRMLTGSSSVATNAILKIQLEEGDTATEFEAPMLPADANHVLPLGSTYYGGTLDVASGVMTVTWKRYVFNGTESWSVQSQVGNVIVFQSNVIAAGSMSVDPDENTRVCSHFPYVASGSGYAGSFFTFGYSSTVFFRMDASLYPNADAFKAFVLSQYNNGTPITLTYKAYTPTSIQLTPTEILSLTQPDKYTPRLNTVYTDASAVQVGYVKSPIREEFELQQAIVGQGGNI